MTRRPERFRQDTRPRSVTLTGWGVLLLGLVNIWRSAGLYRQLELLLELDVTPDPRLQLITSAVWALYFCALAVSIWRRKIAMRWVVPVSLLVYTIYRIGIYLIYPAENTLNRYWLWAVAFGAAIAFSIWALNRPEAIKFFTMNEDAKE